MISFIVSAFNRPNYLTCCLASLGIQQGDSEIIVTCNSKDADTRLNHIEVTHRFGGRILFTVDDGATECYSAAEIATEKAVGDWLCFPSDDSYYVPLFTHRMLDAALMHEWDFVYCDMLYTSRWTVPPWTYLVMDVRPVRQHIDKTCFIVRRELFNGFPGKKNGAPCEADGSLAEELVSLGVRHGKADGGALAVHN